MPTTLRGRILLIVIASTFSLAVINTLTSYYITNRLVTQTAGERLEAQGRLYADKFKFQLSAIRSDAHVLREATPIQKIIRASRAPDRLDPVSGSSLDSHRQNLAVAFTTFLRTRRHFTQIRFIGLADNGREIVRVDRSPAGIQITSKDALQEKANEEYLLALPTLGRSGFYVSKVTLNRENGGVSDPPLPTMRLVEPVRDENGHLFGAVVINVDYEAFLRSAMPNIPPAVQITALNENGDALIFGPGQATPEFTFHLDDTPLSRSQITGFEGLTSHVSMSRGAASILIPVAVGSAWSPFTFGIVASLPAGTFLAPVKDAVRRTTAWSVIFIALATLISAIFARLLTSPLQRLSAQILNPSENRAPIEAVLNSRDEIGDLARAFLDRNNALIDEANQAQAILRQTAEGVLTMDDLGHLRTINPSGIRMFGLSDVDYVGWHVNRLMPDWVDTGTAEMPFDAANLLPDTGSREFIAVHQDGSAFPVDVAISHFRVGAALYVAAMVRDISEREQHLQELTTLIEALKRSNTELDSFAYVASHDLKAPLRVIDNASKWIEEDLAGKLDPESRENLDLIRSRINRMERLLDDLLEHSRIGRVDHGTQMVNGSVLLEEVRGLLPFTPEFKIGVGPGFDDITLPVLPLRPILQNLIGNAIKHHDRSAGRIQLEITETADAVTFRVTDDGPGIAPEHHERVFGLFQTLHPRDEVEGSGMGLAMVKKNVEVFGGSLRLISDGVRSTTFEFTLPKFWKNASSREEAA
ncbi:sensor histidine kinase [Puniceibacterium sediminis]|uniref:sensor histidine kinase n=1 Tax=Puniceibacterium sediminis TaxID=1608407 RepID=UPI0015961EAD|nr:ATP-binding protein [Puniceibacterium sediminis]